VIDAHHPVGKCREGFICPIGCPVRRWCRGKRARPCITSAGGAVLTSSFGNRGICAATGTRLPPTPSFFDARFARGRPRSTSSRIVRSGARARPSSQASGLLAGVRSPMRARIPGRRARAEGPKTAGGRGRRSVQLALGGGLLQTARPSAAHRECTRPLDGPTSDIQYQRSPGRRPFQPRRRITPGAR